MDIPTCKFIHGLLFILGLVLTVGGIATGTNGALSIGLIVAAVNFQQWQKWSNQRDASDQEKPKE
jgi:hypothetical protein